MRRFRITVNGKVFEVEVEELDRAPKEPHTARATEKPEPPPPQTRGAHDGAPKPAAAGATSVEAPLPGLVLDVKVVPGQPVEEGQVLVILEAMKMENEITADQAGVVSEVLVEKGSSVAAGDPLVVLS